MLNTKLLWYNGQWLSANQPIFYALSRNANYADGIFETIRVHKNKIFFWDLHFERLQKGMQTLHLTTSPILQSRENLQNIILELIQRNGIQKAVKVKIQVFRREEYFESNLLEHYPEVCIYCVEEVPLRYVLEIKNVIIYDLVPLNYTVLSSLKTLQRLPYVLAAIHARQNQVSDAILLNTQGQMVECSHSNLFYIVENQIFTPPIQAACLDGTLRKILVQQFDIQEYAFNFQEMEQIEALFTTNVIRGITPISFCKGVEKYFNTQHIWIRRIHHFLNTLLD
ncbi:MAG: aminotransferase class IV [Bacteroidia bacterium]|nr:aminotransferase class IV [Bacteroidia bacterium]MDW8347702.1 aminotransferase class IV [Bacteroidia bacterium]